ncbi:putative RecX protein [Peptoniphilus sp. ING2-D1G]|nr:putative RecX protein [Peptoniphilus sp. ING2-D1G]
MYSGEFMKITKILYNNKTKNYTVCFDNEESITLLEDTIIKKNISKDKTIYHKELTDILFEDQKNKSFEVAVKYLKKLRTSEEMENYLEEKGFSKDIIKDTLKRLCTLNYINDREYALSYCRDKVNLNKYGPKKIAFLLKSKGIDDDIINSSMENLDWDKIIDNLKKDGMSKLKKLEQDDKKWEKTVRYLLNKGYSYDLIKKHL